MATVTATVFAATNTRSVHVGPNTVETEYNGSLSAGDIVVLARIPHGAKIIDFVEHHTSPASVMATDFGLSAGTVAGGAGNASAIASALAKNTVNRGGLLLPVTVSLSDNASPRYANFQAKVDANMSTTAGCRIRIALTYLVGEPSV